MSSMKRFLALLPALFLVPAIALAATAGQTFREIVRTVVTFLSTKIIPIMVAVAVLIFFYNMVQFIRLADNEQERAKFRSYVVSALGALFVILAVWGIVAVISTSIFGGSSIVLPQLPTS